MTINWRGLAKSFMLSVGNDSQWEEPVESSCEECLRRSLPIRPAATDCLEMPLQIYTVINCAYNEIYLKCPPWNPHDIKECEFTKQFIQECF